MTRTVAFYLFFILFLLPTHLQAEADAVVWRPWSSDVFQEAAREHKLVLLDLEAIWCHWCHVMDEQTYRDRKVIEALTTHYISVKVDQDARPDLSHRFEDYGWPATIIFDGKGRVLAKRAGFLEPSEMRALLLGQAAHPSPEPEEVSSVTVSASAQASGLSPALRKELEERHYNAVDPQLGGLRTSHKFLDADSIEFSLIRAARGSVKDKALVIKTLDANLALFDPAWGGVYQYSTGGTWTAPHFEKIMATQANNLRIYSLAYEAFDDARYRSAAAKIVQYLKSFLTSQHGAFYTSQDADLRPGEHSGEYFALTDKERRARGVPRVDTHIYSRENGWAIAALATYAMATADADALTSAKQSADWIAAHRRLPAGGFSHGEVTDTAHLFLGDSLAMTNGLLTLYAASGERQSLRDAITAGKFIIDSFLKDGRLVTARPDASDVLPPIAELDENISGARLLIRLFHYSGDGAFQKAAQTILSYLANPQVAKEHVTDSGILLADNEVSNSPLHLTVVGTRTDSAARTLHNVAASYFAPYKRLDWWDPKEGPLPNPDVQYPPLDRSAAFVCSEKRCSLPVFDPLKLKSVIESTVAN